MLRRKFKHLHHMLMGFLAVLLTAAICVSCSSAHQYHGPCHKNWSQFYKDANQVGLRPHVLRKAFHAYEWGKAHGEFSKYNHILTVVDFSKPSYEQRMWVLDMCKQKILLTLYTTQGSGSGRTMATHFSNQPETHASSLGLYRVGQNYYGQHGLSRHLVGLEKGINDNAWSRSIVVHGASYATPDFVKTHHRAGNSWGCFAVSNSKVTPLVRKMKTGSALFAYAKPEDMDPITR